MRGSIIISEIGQAELFPELYEIVCGLACEAHQRDADSIKGSMLLGGLMSEFVATVQNPRVSGCLNGLAGSVFNASVLIVGEVKFLTFLVSNERLEEEKKDLRGEDVTDKVL